VTVSASTARWGLVIIWMALIFIGAAIPADNLPDGPQVIPILVHFVEYFVLTAVLLWALNEGFDKSVILPVRAAAFILALFYGITDEFHQLFVPGRISDLKDIAVDLAGVIAALIIVPAVARRIVRSTGSENNSKQAKE
jgi:VanZ family protein